MATTRNNYFPLCWYTINESKSLSGLPFFPPAIYHMPCIVDYPRQTCCVRLSFACVFFSYKMDRTITFRTWKGDSKNVSCRCERNSPENNASLLLDIEQKLIYICSWSFMNWIKGRQTPTIPSSSVCWWIPWHMLINSLLCLAALQKGIPHSLIF